MSTDQRASERVGELIHHAFESLLQANTALERLQDLIGLGMDLKQLMAPHSQSTWRFMVPQEQRFRENWKKFISTVEGVESIASHPQQAAVGATEPAPTPLPATTAQTPVEALTVRQNKDVSEPKPDPPSQGPTPPTTPVMAKEESEQTQHLPPAGSIDNPMEIDDSDDDETIPRGSVATPKRRMKAPPPGGGTPGKRRKSASNRPSGSKNPTLAATSPTQAGSTEAVESPKSPGGYKWKPHTDAKIENYGKNRKLLHERLDQLGPPLDVDRSRISHDQWIITRMDIAAIYGGESVSSFPRIRKEAQARHPYRNFLHGNFDHNPFMPPEPGWPGLYFRLDEKNDHRDAKGNPIVYRTFARHADKRCVYIGQYTFTRLEDISKQEWRELPSKTKTIWLKFFGYTLHGNRSLARIALRDSLGEEPTEAQIAAKWESIKPPRVRKALAEELQDDIRRAFNHGEERIVVWGMKCVSYDYGFENDLATKWHALDRGTPQRSGGTKPSGSQGTSKRRWRRRRLSITDDSEGEDEAPAGVSRDHLSRKARCKKPSLHGDSVLAAASGSDGSSDEDEEDLYHDADAGDFSEY